jgi:hypothetical protein
MNCIGDEEFHQELDHPSNFMRMVKERRRTMSAINDESHQLLPSKFTCDGTIDRFELFRKNLENHYEQIDAGYILHTVVYKIIR